MRRKRAPADVFRLTMNKFLSKKKAAPEPVAIHHSESLNALTAAPPETSPGLKKSGTRWKRSKKPVEQKPEINIATVLPPSDDFRTSLLMPNLSARFSMLREQDDPRSLLGKASDDSVLQPRRRSRMMDFGFNASALNDIAEVQSIHSSIKKPWAVERQDSFGSEDGYNSENEYSVNGSVMSRARPGEGNTMFGGRQKVYKIAASGANSTRVLGKPVYEDDMGLSAFQRFRQKERELQQSRPSEDSQGFDFGLEHSDLGDEDGDTVFHDSAKDLTHSPSLSSYDKKRSTTSSTARSEARSSTAATSVASQPVNGAHSPMTVASQAPAPLQAHNQAPATAPGLKRADTKSKRLYDAGLDQHIHDQQNSAMNRLNSIQRQRTLTGGKQSSPVLHSTKSVGSFNERTPQAVYAINNANHPPSGPLPPLKTLGVLRAQNASPMASRAQSPVSPQGPEAEESDVLIQALEPGDRGKATAMGAFNKPKQAFDEQQYLERQQQLQRSQSRSGSQKPAEVTAPAMHQRIGRFEQPWTGERSASSASARSRSRSTTRTNDPPKASNAFQPPPGQPPARTGAYFDKSALPDTHRTFFGNISASESEEEDDDEPPTHNQHGLNFGGFNGRWPNALPSVSEHPALRQQKSKASLAEDDEELESISKAPSRSLRPDAQQCQPSMPALNALAPAPSSQPLNGMMHHLRQKSNQSSIYAEDQPSAVDETPEVPVIPWAPKNLDLIHPPNRSANDAAYTTSSPWDLDNTDSAKRGSKASISPIDSVRPRGPLSSRAPSRTNGLIDRHSEVSQTDSESMTGAVPWQSEMPKQHARDASTATQQEREAFANELAARRNAIQENMKSIVERETHSRGQSPSFRPFGLLQKSSRESVSMDAKRDGSVSSKALKIFGLGGNSNGSSSNLSMHPSERSGISSEFSRPRGDSESRPSMTANGQPRSLHTSDWDPVRPRVDSETNRPDMPNGRSPAIPQGRFRSRSNSAATTGRSRSRTGPYRDDLEKAMIEGMGSIGSSGHPERSPMMPREFTPRPSPDITQHPQFDNRTRDRSGSRSAVSNYFDAKTSQSSQTSANGRPGASAPMLPTLSPNVYSPSVSARPSPTVGAGPFAQNMTPPSSGSNTPSFSPPYQPGQYRPVGVLRKKTISKSDISEPLLVSSTSNVDTVDLPEGASLKNGMDDAPPLPPINPRRRTAKKIWGMGRNDSGEDVRGQSRATPPESDALVSNTRNFSGDNDAYLPRGAPKQSFDNHSTPILQQTTYGMGSTLASPERVQRSPIPPASVEGGMF